MRPDLRRKGAALFELLKGKIAEKYPGAKIETYPEMDPPQMKLTHVVGDDEFQEFSENMETIFKNIPIFDFDAYAQSQTVEIVFKNDERLLENYFNDTAQKTQGPQSADAQAKAQNSLKKLVKLAGGKFSRHFKNFTFSTTRKNFKGMLVAEIPTYDLEQAERITQFLKAVGLQPNLKKLTVSAVMDVGVDYAALYQESYKKFFPSAETQQTERKKRKPKAEPEDTGDARPRKNKKSSARKANTTSKKIAPKKSLNKKKPSRSAKENPQLTALSLIFEMLSPKEQKEFLLRHSTSLLDRAKIAKKLKEALSLVEE
jgi:hypothetical protein